MSATPLRVVDGNGEIVEHVCQHCQTKDDEIAGLQGDIRRLHARYETLKRDKDAEAKDHPAWPGAVALFNEWKRATNHPRCIWTVERFRLVEPFIRNYGADMVRRAIAGIAYDPYTKPRLNGTLHRHDSWELMLANQGKFEEKANCAPKGWKP
jgi:hypothetical protein